ncbi:sigma-54 interaction domain-containing protein [Bradyrhizobium sp.]|uniref:sigma-54 interaction domain-containing protein n=1 Tax=Bradyrhizobium sp. TaxID=376 RepID=UPI002D6472A9|nr:sigma 54-interacting transcriptional regulator [Bradyrhizobium sp.]HZR72678.1 sigma 54-interacting transcriptional regulator [Bradyrhizobium sp.]
METLFERLESLCEGAIAIDRSGRVVYVNEKYLPALGLKRTSEALGRPIEEIIPNSLMRRVAESGEPILLDIMELGGEQLVVTRMPIEDISGKVIGAIGFVLYDRLENLKPLIERVAHLENELRIARRQLSLPARPARYTFDDYVGQSEGIVRAKELAGRAARQNVTVLLTGETGTGKELLAQAIHNASARAEKPFVSVNVAATPETLIEQEFFGTAPGHHGETDRGRDGRFKSADGGTLFLDEIGDMPPALQAKLLRVLQEREIEPLGSDKPVKVDVRIIAATNVDLERRIAEGAFRADLYYRLNVLSIALPPLRHCIGDLEAIAARLLDDVVISGAYPNARITPSGLAALARYDWPGNGRELRNILERALILSDSTRLTGDDFAHILPVGTASKAAAPAAITTAVLPYAEAELAFEKQTLEQALDAAGGQIAEAARMLRISRATFYKKLAKFGLHAS